MSANASLLVLLFSAKCRCAGGCAGSSRARHAPRVTEHPPINRACWASGLIALVLVSVIFVSAGCGATDADPIAERTDLPEVCRVAGKWLTPVGPGNHAIVGEAARLALVGDSRQNYWLLHPSGCTLQSVKLPSPAAPESLELVELTNSAEILVAITDGSRPLRYLLIDASTGRMTASKMPQPDRDNPNFPRVSSDARWAAWLARPMPGKEQVQLGRGDRNPRRVPAPVDRRDAVDWPRIHLADAFLTA